MSELPKSGVIDALASNGWHIIFTDRVRRAREVRRRHVAYLEHAETGALMTVELGQRGQQRGPATYVHTPVSAFLRTEAATRECARRIPESREAVAAIRGADVAID